MSEKLIYTWQDFSRDIIRISNQIIFSPRNLKYQTVYGVPKGGVPLAVALSQRLDLELVPEVTSVRECLVCDDIVASGKTRSRFSKNDFACLHIQEGKENLATYSVGSVANQWVVYPWENQSVGGPEDCVVRMLEYIGEDPERMGLKDTPTRVVKMWGEIFRGYNQKCFPEVTVFPNGCDGVNYKDMILDQGPFASVCEHHIIPFMGWYHFAYIPGEFIIGASKIARVVDFYSAKLQVAERLVCEIVSYFEEKLKPKGLILIMSARHLCKEMRGVKKVNTPFEVIAARGMFDINTDGCKDEFLTRITKSH